MAAWVLTTEWSAKQLYDRLTGDWALYQYIAGIDSNATIYLEADI